MPTGPKHYRFIEAQVEGQPGIAEDCRCMIGEDHDDGAVAQSLDVFQAADIWMSNGKDEDYTFGYSEDELERAAGQG